MALLFSPFMLKGHFILKKIIVDKYVINTIQCFKYNYINKYCIACVSIYSSQSLMRGLRQCVTVNEIKFQTLCFFF